MLWLKRNQDETNVYMQYFYDNEVIVWDEVRGLAMWTRAFFTWILLFVNFVPISLLVTIEVVKYYQAGFIGHDVRMYNIEKDLPAKVQSQNLNEQLGQIEYIFSDKTGTLTENIMDFRQISVGQKSYGSSIRISQQSLSDLIREPVPNVNFDASELMKDLETKSPQADQIRLSLLNLALNHSVMISKEKYCASSPDELALVNAAKYCGFEFCGRQLATSEVCLNQSEQYKLLAEFEFTSDRKMMSAVYQFPSGEIVCFCKGADSKVLSLCRVDENTIAT